jgi:hypothetical protein
MARGFTSAEGRLMRKHTFFFFNVFLPTSLLVFGALMAADARSAELEGALQYPPASAGQDAQPPPPARMVPQPVEPSRTELGFSGSACQRVHDVLIYATRCPWSVPSSAAERKRQIAADTGLGRGQNLPCIRTPARF